MELSLYMTTCMYVCTTTTCHRSVIQEVKPRQVKTRRVKAWSMTYLEAKKILRSWLAAVNTSQPLNFVYRRKGTARLDRKGNVAGPIYDPGS